MKAAHDSSYWQKVIAALVEQIADTGTAIAALAERKKPLCLSAHLGDKKALAEIEKIGAESRQLSAALPDLETAREQAQAALQAAQQAEQHTANIERAEKMRDATFARLELCGKIDKAVVELTDLLILDIQQRQSLSEQTGVQFQHMPVGSLIKSALSFQLLDKRGVNPDHYALHLGYENYRTTAADSMWCQGWVDRVNQRIDQLIGDDPAHKSLSVEEVELKLAA